MSTVKLNVVSVNISEKKGEIKHPVNKISLNSLGIVGDAHAGDWHRQVSLLGKESFERFSKIAGRMPVWGEFAENITTEGMDIFKTHPGDIFTCGKVILEVTQIGKKCHGDGCAVYREVGNCVMPKEGIFTRVIQPGTITPGDTMEYFPKIYKALVITLSDRASNGTYEDLSGPEAVKLLTAYFQNTGLAHEVSYRLIPDNEQMLLGLLEEAQSDGVNVVITTGGTGVGVRDITPRGSFVDDRQGDSRHHGDDSFKVWCREAQRIAKSWSCRTNGRYFCVHSAWQREGCKRIYGRNHQNTLPPILNAYGY